MPDRKDLRDLETELRPSAHALARDSEGSPASEAHGNSLQSQTHDDHSAKRDSLTDRRAAIASRPNLPPSSSLQSDRIHAGVRNRGVPYQNVSSAHRSHQFPTTDVALAGRLGGCGWKMAVLFDALNEWMRRERIWLAA